MDLDAKMRFWTDLLGLTPINGWKVTWGWVDEIPHPDGGNAVGLNETNGETLESRISIRRPRTQAELADLDDTCAHESVHCLGVRMQYLLDAGREVDAHEYLAETLAPAMVKIKGTPKAKYLAKAARTLPTRAKGTTKNMPEDIASLEKAMIEARLAGDAAKVQELFDKWLAAKVAANGAAPAEVAPPEPPPVAKPPEEKPADALPSNDAGMRDDEALQKSPAYAKQMLAAVDAILESREGLTTEQKDFAKGLGTPEKVKAYLKTVPLAKPAEAAKPLEQLGNGSAPRGGAGNANAPGTDAKINALFRILPDNPDDDGVKFGDGKTDGKLVTFSVTGAFAKIKRSTAKMVEEQKARMIRGAA